MRQVPKTCRNHPSWGDAVPARRARLQVIKADDYFVGFIPRMTIMIADE